MAPPWGPCGRSLATYRRTSAAIRSAMARNATIGWMNLDPAVQDTLAVGTHRSGRRACQALSLYQSINGGNHQQSQNSRRNHPAHHWHGDPFHDFGAGARGPEDGKQARHDGPDRHHFGPNALGSALHDGSMQVVAAQGPALGSAPPLHIFQ